MNNAIRPAKFVECCSCATPKMCAPVAVTPGKWFWFCADCARAIASTWAEVCRDDAALNVPRVAAVAASASSAEAEASRG